jgi:hypothetical protein
MIAWNTPRSVELRRLSIWLHARLSSRHRNLVRLPFDSGCTDQSRDRRDVPLATVCGAQHTVQLQPHAGPLLDDWGRVRQPTAMSHS